MPTTTPRKRNAEATRARILGAAQRAFSETGYSHTGIREVARLAETSSTMVLRYFNSKAELFEAALEGAMSAEATLGWSKAEYAAQLADALLDPMSEVRPPVMIALASGDPEAAAIAARVTERHAIGPLAAWLDGEDRSRRSVAIAMLATGFVTYLRQLPLQTLDEGERGRLRDWFVAAVNEVVIA